MERIITTETKGAPEAKSEGWNEWDAVPRDGPAVFVIDTRAFDEEGTIHGRWLDPTLGPGVLHLQVTELLGREPEEGTWAIVDQVGLGKLMAPESVSIAELALLTGDMPPEGLE